MHSKVLALLVLLAIAHGAEAGTYSGLVKPFFYSNSLYLDATTTQMSNRPACATRNYVRLQESDPNDAIFKSKLAILLASWLADRPVVLSGTGTCTGEGDELIFAVTPS